MPERTDAQNIFLETLEWICGKLDLAGIPYMITGGSAVGFWGQIRTTMDIDIVIQVKLENLDSFLKDIKEEAYVDIEDAGQLAVNNRMFNVILHKTCFKVDLIPLRQTPYEMQKFNNRIEMNLAGRKVFVIGPEDLIISKLLWSKSAGGSQKQMGDCESIYRINGDSINTEYLRKWSKILGVEPELGSIEN